MSQDDLSASLTRPAVSDRSALEREEADLVARLRREPAATVVAVHGDQLAVTAQGTLLFVAPPSVREGVWWAFLGRLPTGEPLLVAVSAAEDPAPLGDATWAALRVAGGEWDDRDAEIAVTAVALGRWLVDSGFCPRCGGVTDLRQGGWSRRCRDCGREHFPRTDPAIIVALTDAGDTRLLLGQHAQWVSRNMYSTFAGFVEAGESAEGALHREIQEEAGVAVTDLRFRGSQAWPYPRSLMLGFRATVPESESPRPDGEEIVSVRWFDRAQLQEMIAGQADENVPGPGSIAGRLIREWLSA